MQVLLLKKLAIHELQVNLPACVISIELTNPHIHNNLQGRLPSEQSTKANMTFIQT